GIAWSDGEDDLPDDALGIQRFEAAAGFLQRQGVVDERPDSVADAESNQSPQLVDRAHRRPDHGELPEVDVSKAGRRRVAGGRAGDDERPAGLERANGMTPGRAADGLHDGVDTPRKPRIELVRFV